MADTVGFVRHLPHQLVEAFRSTLEEVRDSDVVLHVVDGSDESPEEQLQAVREVLAEIEADKVPQIVVVNKADAADPDALARLLRLEPAAIVVSARTGQGLDELWQRIDTVLPEPSVPVRTLVPYERGDLIARLHAAGRVDSIEHLDTGSLVIGMAPPSLAAELRAVEAAQAV